MRNRFLPLAILAAGLVPVSGHAAALPAIDSETGSGGRWVSYEFTTDGSPVNFEISANKFSRGEYLAMYLYNDDDTLKAGLGWISVGWKSGAAFEVPSAGIDIGVIESPSPDGAMRILLTMNDPAYPPILTGTYQVLMLAAGDAESWEYRMDGSGVTDVAKEVGDDAFFYLSDDFDAAANVAVHARIPTTPETAPWIGSVSNVGARATLDAHLTIDIEDTLLLTFGSAAFVPSATYSIDSPDGSIDCGFYGCGFNRFEGPYHHGAGSYTFNTTGANAGLSYMAELVLAGADARLP